MSKFIKVTDSNYEFTTTLNVDCIFKYHPSSFGSVKTSITLTNGSVMYVDESEEEIDELIANI